jgi:hypothetical protein
MVMMSAWKEPVGRDARADGQGAEPDGNQLELFEIFPRVDAGTVQPLALGGNEDADSPAADTEPGKSEPAVTDTVGTGGVEMIVSPAATRDFLDVGGADSDDLRRLEESIRWLTNAGAMPISLPRTAPLPSVIGLSRVGSHEGDSLLLDPDTLFPPHSPRRRTGIAAGVAKIILVSTVAAPTAYFIASWSQFPGAAAPSDAAAVSAVAIPVVLSEQQVAVVDPDPSGPALQAARSNDEISKAVQAEPAGSRAVEVVAAVTGPKAAPEPPPSAAAAPVEAAKPPPTSVAMPPKPSLGSGEIAMLIERGHVLFESGDVAAARLFFRRAANAGDPAAAAVLGSTYDPKVLAERFIRGIEADSKEAQKWYEKAREMETHVEMLAHNR